ncbi:MAG: flagellar biosynthesis protein FlhB [Acidobacteriota bacterium]
MSEFKDSKTERPTPRKLQKAREKGQVARSKEVPSAFVLLGGFVFLSYGGMRIIEGFQSQVRGFLTLRPPAEFTPTYVMAMATYIVTDVLALMGPALVVVLMLSTGANVIQGGVTFSWHQLGFRFEKLNPKNGLSKVFSKNGIVELLKGLALLIVILAVSYGVIREHLPLYPRLVLMDAGQLLYWTALITYRICLRVGVALLVISAADFVFQKHRFTEQLKMTKQEVKDEFKDLEGDPLTRSRIRRIQREMARKRMMADVPTADVVVTNPTHYAVALSYKMESMEAPKVVAKGVGFLAIRIKELAQMHDIPLVENPPLARMLYKTVEVGAFIPVQLYQAVAEILAYIYKIRNKWPAQPRPSVR